MDADTFPASERAELYHCRWQAEVDLRHLKETLGIRVLRSQAEAGAERELLAFVLMYNLLFALLTVIVVRIWRRYRSE